MSIPQWKWLKPLNTAKYFIPTVKPWAEEIAGVSMITYKIHGLY